MTEVETENAAVARAANTFSRPRAESAARRCPACGSPFSEARDGCADCGWEPYRNHHKGRERGQARLKPATWPEILAAGVNPGLVVSSSFSLVGRVFGWGFLLICIPFFLYMSPSLPEWIAGEATVWQVTTIGYLSLCLYALLRFGSGFCTTLFDVCVSSARGQRTASIHPNSGGLIYGIFTTIVVGFVAALPLLLLAIANEAALARPIEHYADVWNNISTVLAAGVLCCLLWFGLYAPMGFLAAAVAGSLNPVTALRWLWHCFGGYAGTLLVFKIWAFVIAAFTAGYLALVAYGTYATIEACWPEATGPIFSTQAYESDEFEEMSISAVWTTIRDDIRAKATRIQNRDVPVEASLVLFAGIFLGLLGICYFAIHQMITLSRMLGLVARRYESRLLW